jgi:hypothetical protein
MIFLLSVSLKPGMYFILSAYLNFDAIFKQFTRNVILSKKNGSTGLLVEWLKKL